MERYPYSVDCVPSGANACLELYRMTDGVFHVISPGRIDVLLTAPDYVLAESSLASILVAVCMPDIHARPAVIVRRATGETTTSHDELLLERELHQDEISRGILPDGNAWRFAGSLFVAPHVREVLISLGLSELRFAPGLSNFA